MGSDDSTTPEITKETKDVRGLTTETADSNSNSTFYTYDPFGNLETVKDSAGNKTTNIYDVRGNKRDTFDPDMGHWHYEYDVLRGLYLALQNAAKKPTTPVRDWKAALNQFVVLFGDRVLV